MKKIINKITVIYLVFLSFFCSQKIYAAFPNMWRTAETGEKAGYDVYGPYSSPHGIYPIIQNIIIIVLGLLGVIFLIQIITAGYQYLTSGGNEETIKHAKDRIKTSVIGLVIVLVAYVITSFVITQLINTTSGGGSGYVSP